VEEHMSFTLETVVPAPATAPHIELESGDDRLADIEAKHAKIAALLKEVGCDGLLVLEPENFAWLTSGAASRGILDPAEQPALYFNADGRWVLSSNVDSQRLFDEELDGLGFQLKEWPWHWGRAQLLADICQGKRVAFDLTLTASPSFAEPLRSLRRTISNYELACYRALGLIVSHALEATCRTMKAGESEREVAGQISHRLIHRGCQPVHIGVSADGRSRVYRQFGFTSTPIHNYGVLIATARKYGLCATASRSVIFNAGEPVFRKEHDVACRACALYIASSWPESMPREIFNTAKRVYHLSGAEHEWLLAPQGFITGRSVVELPLTTTTEDLLQPNWAVTWRGSGGAAICCDTVVITDDGPKNLTPTDNWPLKRIRVQGAEFLLPDLLQR
jgi:Xaa-Pro dipeptidase